MTNFHPVDVHVGARLRERRPRLRISLAKAAKAIGVTYQQVLKYETGDSSIAPVHLLGLAKVLGVRVSYFFDDMPPNVLAGRPVSRREGEASFGAAGTPFGRDKNPLSKPETQALLRAYWKIRHAGVRKGIYQLMQRIDAAGRAEVPRG